MTVEEFGKLAAAIKTYYPRDNILPTEEAMELWFDMLKDLDYKAAVAGLRGHLATNKFAPTIADIRAGAMAVAKPHELNEQAAWSLVALALRNSSYHAEEEFAKLPSIVQKAVGQPSQLRFWATDENYNEGVTAAGFMRAYRAEVARSEETAKMPPDVRKLIENVNEKQTAALEAQRREATAAMIAGQAESSLIGDKHPISEKVAQELAKRREEVIAT